MDREASRDGLAPAVVRVAAGDPGTTRNLTRTRNLPKPNDGILYTASRDSPVPDLTGFSSA